MDFLVKKLAVSLAKQSLELITKIRFNKKEKVIHHIKYLFLNKKHIIETINN